MWRLVILSCAVLTRGEDVGKARDSYVDAFKMTHGLNSHSPLKTNRDSNYFPDHSQFNNQPVYEVNDEFVGIKDGYGPPKETYGPPKDSYGPPKNNYGPPKDVYGPPKDIYGPPKDIYGLPKDLYGPPKELYGPPKDNYATTKDVYGPPQNSYGPPADHYPPQPIYGPPNNYFPSPLYGIPEQLYKVPHAMRGILDKIKFKLDLFTIGKIILKLAIFKKIVSLIAILCLLLFIPSLKSHSTENDDHHGPPPQHDEEEDIMKRSFSTNIGDDRINRITSFALESIEKFGQKYNDSSCSSAYCKVEDVIERIHLRFH